MECELNLCGSYYGLQSGFCKPGNENFDDLRRGFYWRAGFSFGIESCWNTAFSFAVCFCLSVYNEC